MPDYVPTGGGNDPNTWQDNPMYGQGVEANRGAGYNPNSGLSYDQFKANKRAYRAQFQRGGKNYDRYMNTYAAIGAARPRNEQELGQRLNSLGIYNQKEQGQSLYRSIGMDFNNTVNGMYHYDPASGMKYNVATSDVNGRGPQAMTADDWNNVNRGFYGRIDDMFGGQRFAAWNAAGKTGLKQGPNGFWYNPGAGGAYVGGTMYDSAGWAVDPTTGRRVGGGYMPGMGDTPARYSQTTLGSMAAPQPIAPAPTSQPAYPGTLGAMFRQPAGSTGSADPFQGNTNPEASPFTTNIKRRPTALGD